MAGRPSAGRLTQVLSLHPVRHDPERAAAGHGALQDRLTVSTGRELKLTVRGGGELKLTVSGGGEIKLTVSGGGGEIKLMVSGGRENKSTVSDDGVQTHDTK